MNIHDNLKLKETREASRILDQLKEQLSAYETANAISLEQRGQVEEKMLELLETFRNWMNL